MVTPLNGTNTEIFRCPFCRPKLGTTRLINRSVRVPPITPPPVVATSFACEGITETGRMKLVMAGSFLRAGCENVADIDDGELDTVQVVNHRFHVGGQPRVARQI